MANDKILESVAYAIDKAGLDHAIKNNKPHIWMVAYAMCGEVISRAAIAAYDTASITTSPKDVLPREETCVQYSMKGTEK